MMIYGLFSIENTHMTSLLAYFAFRSRFGFFLALCGGQEHGRARGAAEVGRWSLVGWLGGFDMV